MKEATKTAFAKLGQITQAKCATCPAPTVHRCCDKIFCGFVEEMLVEAGEPTPPKPNIGGIPFMGENGCVLSPEQRPFCTGYVCAPHTKDRVFRREYDRLILKINRDPKAPKMGGVRGTNTSPFK
jgi:hypothetical protein